MYGKTPANRWLALSTLLSVFLAGCSEAPSVADAPPPSDPPAEDVVAAEPEPPQPAHLTDPPEDPRTALTEALVDGLLSAEVSTNEKLSAVLEAAGVSEASQVLVFSKTSLQNRLISPANPRAIYFNDDCYIGYVPGGLIEYGDTDDDPKIGSGLLTLDMRKGAHARFEKDGSCLICHSGSRTYGRRGFFVRSVFPDDRGLPITSAGSTDVGQHTPFEKRWGGWYVTGSSGKMLHRGNQTTEELPNGDAVLDNAIGSNIEDLSPYFGVQRYLRPTSDIVALMVLEHQVQMHNRLTQGSGVVQESYERAQSIAESLGEPFDPANSDTLQRVIASNASKIVRHMLYINEIKLTDPVSGSEEFQHAFRANRREDGRGRSLKDFDLQTRMFKHRCSYMIYSRAYTRMQPLLKQAVEDKLRGVLEGQGDPDVYGHLGEEERKVILEILEATGVL